MKRIAILTSGGDAPGMNAAIRPGIDKGFEIFGVREGFRGLIDGDFLSLDARLVSGILTVGGTMLGSARCREFKDESVQKVALRKLEDYGVSGLIVIGGGGSQTSAAALSKLGFPTLGIGDFCPSPEMGVFALVLNLLLNFCQIQVWKCYCFLGSLIVLVLVTVEEVS